MFNGRSAPHHLRYELDSTNAVLFQDRNRQMSITNFFHPSRTQSAAQGQLKGSDAKENEKSLFFTTDSFITPNGLLEAGGRAKVTVNDQEIALIYHDQKIYAVQEKCPHMGGPLHVGDIEDKPGCGPCVKCPHHKWTFSLRSGDCIFPSGRKRDGKPEHVEVYPVRFESNGQPIKIGFSEFAKSLFNTPPE